MRRGGAWKVRVKTGGARGLREVTVIYRPSTIFGFGPCGGEGTKTVSEKGREGGGAQEGGRRNVEGRVRLVTLFEDNGKLQMLRK